jgi:hypothetical protein
MSELMNSRLNREHLRWHLLTTVSALALVAAPFHITDALASEGDHPTVWIELGGQLEHIDSGEEKFVPPFILAPSQPAIETISPLSLQHPARYSFGGEAGVTIVPHDSDWVFSASVRYGRSNAAKHVHQQSDPVGYPWSPFGSFAKSVEPLAAQFVDTRTQYKESHLIADFQIGRDVGLGLFGQQSSSTVNAGVRFAQFTSRSSVDIRENPDWHFSPKYVTIPSYGLYHFKLPYGQPYHSFDGSFEASRSFRGIGPSISWKNATVLVGNEDSAVVADWGLNGALLFGRQKAETHHRTIDQYHAGGAFVTVPAQRTTVYDHPATPDHTRSRSVIVPNLGGFAGLTVRYPNAKVSLGYRADFFFGAMDGGIDTRKTYNRDFYGPYATISVGLGG